MVEQGKRRLAALSDPSCVYPFDQVCLARLLFPEIASEKCITMLSITRYHRPIALQQAWRGNDRRRLGLQTTPTIPKRRNSAPPASKQLILMPSLPRGANPGFRPLTNEERRHIHRGAWVRRRVAHLHEGERRLDVLREHEQLILIHACHLIVKTYPSITIHGQTDRRADRLTGERGLAEQRARQISAPPSHFTSARPTSTQLKPSIMIVYRERPSETLR